jgi:MFS-type transporter involved in bile tolerance (Atg22 family)
VQAFMFWKFIYILWINRDVRKCCQFSRSRLNLSNWNLVLERVRLSHCGLRVCILKQHLLMHKKVRPIIVLPTILIRVLIVKLYTCNHHIRRQKWKPLKGILNRNLVLYQWNRKLRSLNLKQLRHQKNH